MESVKIRNAKKCSRCTSILKEDEYYTCERCLARSRKQSRKYREMAKANNLCLRCGKPHDRGKAFCQECADYRNAITRQTRSELRKMGICPNCGKRKLFGDEKSCIECRSNFARLSHKRHEENPEKIRMQHRESSKRVRMRRAEQGVCTECGGKRDDKRYKMCGRCRAKVRNRRLEKTSDIRLDKRSNGICRFCNEPVEPGFRVCETHHQHMIEMSHGRTKIQIRKCLKYSY